MREDIEKLRAELRAAVDALRPLSAALVAWEKDFKFIPLAVIQSAAAIVTAWDAKHPEDKPNA